MLFFMKLLQCWMKATTTSLVVFTVQIDYDNPRICLLKHWRISPFTLSTFPKFKWMFLLVISIAHNPNWSIVTIVFWHWKTFILGNQLFSSCDYNPKLPNRIPKNWHWTIPIRCQKLNEKQIEFFWSIRIGNLFWRRIVSRTCHCFECVCACTPSKLSHPTESAKKSCEIKTASHRYELRKSEQNRTGPKRVFSHSPPPNEWCWCW